MGRDSFELLEYLFSHVSEMTDEEASEDARNEVLGFIEAELETLHRRPSINEGLAG